MSYTVRLKRSAERELKKLPTTMHDRVVKELARLAETPRPHNVKKLSGQEGYRLRVGDYRVLYLIDDAKKTIEIIAVGHRREVYR